MRITRKHGSKWSHFRMSLAKSLAKRPRLSLSPQPEIDPIREVIHCIEDGTKLSRFILLLKRLRQNSQPSELLFKSILTMKDVAKGWSPLVIAVESNRVDILEYVLKNFVVNIEQETTSSDFSSHPVTALWIASCLGNIECVKLLVSEGADVNHLSPLLIAAGEEHNDICKYLVDNNASIEGPSDKQLSPLIRAIVKENKELVEYFVKKGANVNCKVDLYGGNTPLHFTETVEIAEILIKAGAICCTNDDGLTPAVFAALRDNDSLVYLLIDAFQCDIREQYDCYCLLAATNMQSSDNVDKARRFMKKAVRLRISNPNYFTDLPHADDIYNGIQEPSTMADYLTIMQSKTRMYFVCSIYCERILGRTYSQRDTIMYAMRDCLNDTLFHHDYDRSFQFCHRVLDFQLSPNIYDDYCFPGDLLIVVESVSEMVDNGYTPHIQPLFQCGLKALNVKRELADVRLCDESLISCLVQLISLWIKVADKCFQDSADQEREHTLITNAVQEIIDRCENNGTSILLACLDNVSIFVERIIALDVPLHKVLTLFLDHGCPIHCQDEDGNFPLHLLAQLPDLAATDCVSTLLDYGAHFDAVNFKNQTAMEVEPYYDWEYDKPTYFLKTLGELESFRFQ